MLALLGGAHSQASATWELRVCADPSRLPFTTEEGSGFENRVAELIAAELDADLVYEWVPFTNMHVVRNDYLWTGRCDMIFGLEDGEEGYLHSVAYYRSPYVFVQQANTAQPVGSFDDLEGLSLALQDSGTPPHVALAVRGLLGQIELSNVYGPYGSTDWLSRIVDVVADGTVDVGIAWGPTAGYFAEGLGLTVTPVSPEIEPPFLLMLKSVTIGFRPGDDALRDRVNTALAARWNEIQTALTEYQVPLSFLPAPHVPSEPSAAEQLRIGVILPEPPSSASLRAETGVTAISARNAAELAGSEAARRAEAAGKDVLVLYASAPDQAAASRAAGRLRQVDGVHALIGGLGEGQPEALVAVASEAGIPFMNIGDIGTCNSLEFRLTPSPSTYLKAYAKLHSNVTSWFVIFEDSARGQWLAELASDDFKAHSRAIAPDTRVFTKDIQAIRAAGSDGVLVLLEGEAQMEFLGQLAAFEPDMPVVGLPGQVTQTRAYYDYLIETVPELASQPRLALWDASLPAQVNDSYSGRFGAPLEPGGWTAYAAVNMLTAAYLAAGSDRIVDHLSGGGEFDVGKEGVAFDPRRRELMQELYVVQLADRAPSRSPADRLLLGNRLDAAKVVDVVSPPVTGGACEPDRPQSD